MLTEKIMEDAVAQNPEKYIEPGLVLIKRQYRIGKYIFDLLFQDRHGAKLIVELQKGTLDRNHTYKILDYYDEYKLKNPKEFVELMIIANKIPRERRDRLSSNGIAFKEIPTSDFLDGDTSFETNLIPEHEPKVEDKKSISYQSWDTNALQQIESWLLKFIQDCSVGETFEIGRIARQSRQIGHILPRGNIEGFRHLLGKVTNEGYVEVIKEKHFRILKKPE
jgi:hypothetical protein